MTELYEYTPQDAVKMAGTLTAFKGETDPAEFTGLPGIQTMVEVGNQATTIDQTTVEDTSKRYIAGIKDGADQTLEFVDYAEDEGQKKFKEAANKGEIVTIKHQWPSGTTAEYRAALLGWKKMSGGVEDLERFSVTMKLNGDVTWGTASPEV